MERNTIFVMGGSIKKLNDISSIGCVMHQGKPAIYFYGTSLIGFNDFYIKYNSETKAEEIHKIILQQVKDGLQIIDIDNITSYVMEKFEKEISEEEAIAYEKDCKFDRRIGFFSLFFIICVALIIIIAGNT